MSAASFKDPNRFYDGLCPPFLHEPTKDRFALVHSDTMGIGLTSLNVIAKGEIVFRFYGPILQEQTLFTLQIAPGTYIEDPLVMGRVLHACDPNMICDMTTLTFIATKPIGAGEYLTMDYEMTEDELFRSFECCCGSPHCRGAIRGKAQMPERPAKKALAG